MRYRGGGMVMGRIGGRRFSFRLRRGDTTPPEIELGAARGAPRVPAHRPPPRVP